MNGVQPDWNILARSPDVGQAFATGLQTGQAMRKQQQTDAALQAYATNPNDPNAVNALMVASPELGFRARHQQAAQREAALEAQREEQQRVLKLVGGAAQQAKTPEAWDAAVDQLVGLGIADAAKYKGKFSPETRAAIMNAAGVKEEEMETIVVDGVVLDKRTMKPVWESPYPRIVSGAGGVHIQPRIGLGAGGGGAAPQAKVIPLPNGLPAGWTIEDDGGASQGGSPTFP